VQKVWDDLLSKASLVVFCGYGGVDQFDVVPYFAAKPAMSINCNALWLQHADQVPVQMGSVGHMPADMMLSKFRLSGVIKGLAGFVLNELLPTMPQIAQMRRIGGYRNEVRQLVQRSAALYAASSKDFDLLKQAAGAAIRIILRTPSRSREHLAPVLRNALLFWMPMGDNGARYDDIWAAPCRCTGRPRSRFGVGATSTGNPTIAAT
jgi:hypothetical protein